MGTDIVEQLVDKLRAGESFSLQLDESVDMNLSLQGRDTTILKLYDRVGGFLKKAELWKRLCAEGDISCFPQFDSFVVSENIERDTVKTFLDGHLANVISSFKSYFTDVREKSEQLDWVRNPFTLSQSNRVTLPVHLREELLDLSTDRGLQTTFENCSLTEFWVCVRREHPELGKSGVPKLLPFGSTYLCENSFSAMTQIKTKQRNRLCLENSLITAVASLPPRMSKILKKKDRPMYPIERITDKLTQTGILDLYKDMKTELLVKTH
ncbi:putative zinc finger BED domain-containing protein 5-like [Triplophysa rosa]|uniref:Zinc finger BED domain-containing protein 5-like n=1 Tax=Triplophysa rosa TaxID=992332 RepID=A0A9W7T3M8_TRIRA|nr:putative zinc finger BED domain-containing protein 5-like [Triplophysa rosa]